VWGLTPLEDQQIAGLLMWVPMGLPYLVVGLWLASRLLARDFHATPTANIVSGPSVERETAS
jgi:cytochrome c oxidase assembly factor CtaG